MAVLATLLFFGFQRLLPLVGFLEGTWLVWWPVNGMALSALLLVPRRHWWWLLLGFSTALVLAERGDTPLQLAVVGVCNPLEVVSIALVLPKFRNMDKWMSQPGVTWRFILMVLVAGPAAATLVSLAFPEAGVPVWVNAARWAGADALGTLLSMPLVLSLLSPELWKLFQPRALLKTVGLFALIVAISWIVFHQGHLPIAFVVYPVILLLGTQLGLSGAVVGTDLLAIIAISTTLRGLGPFGAIEGTRATTGMLLLQLYLLLSISMTLPVSVARVRRLTTEAKLLRAWQHMETLAAVDGLTGVANRRRFDSALAAEWARALRERVPIALLMVDADRFKAYNDNYGHLAGDACLRAIASAIEAIPKRPSDLVARYGGEEFAILLPHSDIAGAHSIAESVRRGIHELALPHLLNEEQRVTVSIGLSAVIPSKGADPLQLIAASDKALYEAKHNGRNQVRVAIELAAANG